MSEFLKLVFSLSLSGSALILLLLLAKPLLRDRLSKRWQYYIWLLVIVRLLVPFGPPESPAEEIVQDMNAAAVSVLATEPPRVSADTNPDFETEPEPEPTALQRMGGAIWNNLWLIWLAGAAVLLIRKLTAYQSFLRYVKAGWEPVDDPALLDRAAEIGAEIGVKRPIELYVNPLIASPMLLGVRKPCVVLPSAGLPEEDFRYVLLHELTHCRRQDVLYKWLMQLTVCVHWFNPLVHWMSREVERSGELSCDEAVLRKLDEPSRRAYGDALLRTTAAGGGYKAALPSATLGESGELLKERLETIMKFKRPTRLSAILALLLAAALGVTATAAGAYTGVSVPAGAGHEVDITGGYWEHAVMQGNRFTRECFYQSPYMFEIAWNCSAQENFVPVKLPDGSEMKVWLGNPAFSIWLENDKDAVKALSEVIVQIWTDSKDTEFPLTSPMLWFYRNMGGIASGEMAETFYKQHDLPAFKTAFALLNEDGQKKWMEKIYTDGDISFFSLAAAGLKVDGKLVKSYAEKAYQDGAYSYFSVLANSRMSEDLLEDWLDRAKADKQYGFQSILRQRLGEDEELEKLKAELDKEQDEKYKAVGVTVDGKNRYYQGKLVNIFLDHREDSSFYVLDMNPKGSINIKIVRDKDGKITGVAYLTQAEITELFGDMDDPDEMEDDWDDWSGGDEHVVDVDIDKVKDGEFIWLGTFEMEEGYGVYYDLTAESGKNLTVGFAKAGEKKPGTVYMTVADNQDLEIDSGPMSWGAPEGSYSLFIHTKGGELRDVSGYVTIIEAE